MRNIILIFSCLLFGGCTTARMIVYNIPTNHDSELFYNIEFPAVDSPRRIATPLCEPCDSLDALFEDMYTSALVVMRGDSIVYSRFSDCGDIDTRYDLFSMSKSYIGALLGIAISQGYLKADDPLSKYLPAMAGRLSDSVRIIDLADMRGGIGETPYQTALLYYSPELSHSTAQLHSVLPLGMFSYASRCTQLLGYVLEAATGVPLDRYFMENYWIPTAPSTACYWSIDSPDSRNIRSFCGLSIATSEVLKLGMIYRDNGLFDGRRIVPDEWIATTLNPPSESSDRSNATYRCQWYVVRPDREFIAQGLLGQVMYVNRDTDVIVVRFGTGRGRIDWAEQLGRIAAYPTVTPDKASVDYCSFEACSAPCSK